MNFNDLWNKAEKFFGNLKFAVFIISIFALFMIVGTFLESYYGTDYANRMIYKTIPFMGIQFFMFISIIMALFLRLPAKKYFYGFYTIHLGLILMACGSFITWFAGVDGHITLDPNTPTRKIELGEDQLQVSLPLKGKMAILNLPFTPFKKELGESYQGIKFKTFYPYSENKLEWLKEKNTYPPEVKFPSTQYLIYNDNIDQEFVLSLHPEAPNFQSSMTMGLLNLHYLPEKLSECFNRTDPSKLIFWNSVTQKCSTPEERKAPLNKTTEGKTFVVIQEQGTIYSFFPDLSPWPIGKDKEIISNSPLRIFNKKLFEKKPHLFLFGKKVAYSIEGEWELVPIHKNKPINLPWMGFELKILHHTLSKVPAHVPYYTTPIQKNGKVIKGNQKAILAEIQGHDYWVTDKRPLNLLVDGENVKIHVVKKSLTLPFEFSLKRFKMDTNPGTNDPASYESFVRLFHNSGTENHHIYMNNPLKYDGFTFYQASYFKTGNQNIYGSVLSANVDPGRPFKYLGALFLVLGSLWHYYIRRKKGPQKPQSMHQPARASS